MGEVRRVRKGGRALAVLVVGLLAACQTSTTEPTLEIDAVTGVYSMSVLRFDPDGSLVDSNLLPPLGNPPQLTLTVGGQAQIVWLNPTTSLVTTVPGTYVTTGDGVRVEFGNESDYGQFLLSREMHFTYSAEVGVLAFDGSAPEGVLRGRLVALAPSLAGEQLLDPTPGRLRVSFSRN